MLKVLILLVALIKQVMTISSKTGFRVGALVAVLISVAAMGLALLTPGRAASIHTIPGSIASKTTCDETMPDVTKQIEDWLNSIPAGDIAQFGENKCYRTELRLTIGNRQGIIIDGNGSRLQAMTDGCDSQDPNPTSNNNPYDFCRFTQYPKNDYNWPRNRMRLSLQDNKNLTIKNLELDGGHPNPGPNGTYLAELEAQHGFDFGQGNDGVLVDNVVVNRVWGDYMYINGSKNITVQNSVFGKEAGDRNGNGRMGMGIVNLTNVTIKNNEFANMRRSCIDFEPLTNKAQIVNFTFADNKVGFCRFNFVSMNPYGSAYPVVEGIYFLRNKLIGKGFSVGMNASRSNTLYPPADPNKPELYRWKDFKFIENTSDKISGNPGGAVMGFEGITDIEIRNNKVVTQTRTPTMVLVQFNWVRNAKVIGNSALYATEAVRDTVGYNLNRTQRTLNNKEICQRDNYIGNPLKLETLLPTDTECPPDEPPPPPPDTTPPSAPQGLQANLASDNQSVSLSWQASTDNVAVSGYELYRKIGTGAFARIGSPAETSYIDNSIAAGKQYTYQVAAVDSTGNESARSSSVSVTVPPSDTFLPADINQDGTVNLVDFSLLSSKFGQTANLGRADINNDNKCDLLDFSLLASQFGS